MNMKTDFQNLAINLIESVFGSVAQQVIIRRPLYTNYDEEIGSYISASQDYTIKGIVGPWSKNNQAAATSDGIESDDLSLIVSRVTLSFDPQPGSDIVILPDNSEYSIVLTEKDEAEATVTMRLSKGTEE